MNAETTQDDEAPRDGRTMPRAVKRCDLCETILEYEHPDGRRLVFTAHDAAYCTSMAGIRIRLFKQALEQAARDRAEVEGSLRRRLYRQDIEIDLLREALDDAINGWQSASMAHDPETTALRRAVRDRDAWERRVVRRMREHEAREAERLVEMQRMGMLPPTSTLAAMLDDEARLFGDVEARHVDLMGEVAREATKAAGVVPRRIRADDYITADLPETSTRAILRVVRVIALARFVAVDAAGVEHEVWPIHGPRPASEAESAEFMARESEGTTP